LPEGTLGRAYLEFVERERISVEGLSAASDAAYAGRRPLEPARVRYRDRFRDMHDLWHVATGYGREALGEICLLAFTYAQTRQRGFGLVAMIWSIKEQALRWRTPVLACALEGTRLGRRARWLLEQDWEWLLEAPLPVVRRTIGVAAPRTYLRYLERTGRLDPRGRFRAPANRLHVHLRRDMQLHSADALAALMRDRLS
jgi:ubiquinone biosynthesis protein COQ4